MNKYLEKIAKEYYSTTEVADTRASSALGGALIGGVTAHQLNGRLGNLIQHHYVAPMLHHKPTASPEVMKRIVDDVLPRTSTVLDIRQAGGSPEAARTIGRVTEAVGPHYMPYENLNAIQRRLHGLGQLQNRVGRLLGKDSIPTYDGSLGGTPSFNKNVVSMAGARNTDILAHELGHAVDFNTGNVKLKKALVGIGRRLHGVPSAALGGLALTNENTRDYAWAVPLLAAAPTLREEAAANIHAYNLVKKHGGDASKLGGMFRRNLTSYALPALAAGGALAGINYLRRKGEEVDPDEWIKDR